MKRIIYLTHEGLSSTVIESQVFGICRKFSLLGYEVRVWVAQPFLSRIPFKKYFRLLFDKKVSVIFDGFGNRISMLVFLVKFIIQLIRVPQKDLILICRNPISIKFGLFLIKFFPDITVIYDVRGASEEEKKAESDFNKMEYFSRINGLAFSNARLLYNFISEELKNYYEKRYSVNLLGRYVICPSSSVFEVEEKDLEGENLRPKYVYIGGVQNYQNLEKVINEFDDVDLTLILPRMPSFQVPSYVKVLISPSVPEMISTAVSCDYGILWRNEEVFNLVATPTKITEYWSLGLRLIAINNAGAYTTTIEDNPFLGTVLSPNQVKEDLRSLASLNKADRKQISSYVREHFGQEVNARKYDAFLKDMLRD